MLNERKIASVMRHGTEKLGFASSHARNFCNSFFCGNQDITRISSLFNFNQRFTFAFVCIQLDCYLRSTLYYAILINSIHDNKLDNRNLH